MHARELDTVLDWAAAEGWNPGLDDAAAFLATDPEGFFVAEADGVPVAAISVVNHGPDFAFLGLYLCRPAWRGQGIGLGLWTHALRHAGTRTVGLDGVPAQQENYRRSGFVLAGQTCRFAGTLAAEARPGLRAARPDDLPTLSAMEAAANGYAKPAFLDAWMRPAPGRQTLVCEQAGDIAGFAVWRACREGTKIGPLVAGDIGCAETLLAGVATAAGGPFFLDVPDDCAPLMAWCRDRGWEMSFGTARMYRGDAPRPGTGLRSIATMELG